MNLQPERISDGLRMGWTEKDPGLLETERVFAGAAREITHDAVLDYQSTLRARGLAIPLNVYQRHPQAYSEAVTNALQWAHSLANEPFAPDVLTAAQVIYDNTTAMYTLSLLGGIVRRRHLKRRLGANIEVVHDVRSDWLDDYTKRFTAAHQLGLRASRGVLEGQS